MQCLAPGACWLILMFGVLRSTEGQWFPPAAPESTPAPIKLKGDTVPGFLVSLQPAGSVTTDNWAEVVADLDELEEFTVCHWDYYQFYTRGYQAVWSHCHSRNDSDMTCTRFSEYRN